jgi:hypothetical protein
MGRDYGTTNVAPYAAAPAVGPAGDTYFNTTSKLLYLSDGTSWLLVGSIPPTNYFYASGSSYAGTAGTWLPITWGSPAIQNVGFTFAGPSTNITVTVAGKYRIASQMWGYPTANGANNCNYRITHLDSTATLKVNRDFSNVMPGSANFWFQALAEGVFDCAVGDIIVVYANPAATMAFAGAYIEITQIGNQVTPETPSYAYLGITNTGAMGTGGALLDCTLGAASPPYSFLSSFTIQGSSKQLRADRAGRYNVVLELTLAYTSSSTYSAARIAQFNSIGTSLAYHDISGSGGPSVASLTHVAVFDMAIGDYLTFQAMNGGPCNWDSRSYIVVTPVGAQKGDPGFGIPAGGAVGNIISKKSATNYDVQWSASGTELAYNTQPSTVNITATTAASAQQIVAASPITFDGATSVWLEFYCSYAFCPSTTIALTITLWDGSTDLGNMAGLFGLTGTVVTARRRLTPSAGSHTYSIRAYVGAAGTGGLQAAAANPTYQRIVVA